jgi:hypothetical protein
MVPLVPLAYSYPLCMRIQSCPDIQRYRAPNAAATQCGATTDRWGSRAPARTSCLRAEPPTHAHVLLLYRCPRHRAARRRHPHPNVHRFYFRAQRARPDRRRNLVRPCSCCSMPCRGFLLDFHSYELVPGRFCHLCSLFYVIMIFMCPPTNGPPDHARASSARNAGAVDFSEPASEPERNEFDGWGAKRRRERECVCTAFDASRERPRSALTSSGPCATWAGAVGSRL